MKQLLLVVLIISTLTSGCSTPTQSEQSSAAQPAQNNTTAAQTPPTSIPPVTEQTYKLEQMFIAAETGDTETFRAIIDAHPDWLHSRQSRWEVPALNYACWYGHIDIVKLCIDRGGDVNAHHEEWKWYPLHEAAGRGHIEIAELLLDHGAEINAVKHDGLTPILMAANNGYFEFVDMLLERGADTEGVDEEGWAFLHMAAANVNTKTVKLLLNKGSDVNQKTNDGRTPLHWTANIQIAQLLIDHGASVNATSEDGRTPLHLAAFFGFDEIVELLIYHNADINVRDNDGATPLDLAFLENHGSTIILLKSYNAQPGNTSLDDTQSSTTPIASVGPRGQLLVNGQPTIPFAVWMQPIRQLSFHKQIGLDCIMFPSFESYGPESHKQYIDAVESLDLSTFTHYEEIVAQSPNIWGWQGEYTSSGQSRRAYEYLRNHDRSRLIICNFKAHDLVKHENSDFYHNAFDYVDCIVPHVWPNMFKDEGEPANLHYPATLVKNVRKLCEGREKGELCIFVDINVHEWHKDNILYPAPSVADFKYQVWSSLIAGADGICIFPISFQPFVFNQMTAQIAKHMPAITEQVKSYTEILTSPESSRPITIKADNLDLIDFTTRRYNGEDYIFLTNGPEQEQTIQLTISGPGNTLTFHDMIADKSLPFADGQYQQKVPPLGLCIWKVTENDSER